jgi:hypothetical protein
LDEYHRIPIYPDHVSATSVLTRLLDGLGFRFYWATEGLRVEDYGFRPAKDTMSIGELVIHVWSLVNWVSSSTFNRPYEEPRDGPAAREGALGIIRNLRETMLAMSDEDLGKLRIRDSARVLRWPDAHGADKFLQEARRQPGLGSQCLSG